tara:strand:- start:47 stop:649 length:603 start_codon:yes stop_codon:yes gene_type:complete
MKKLSTYLFLILFSFSTSSFADDIRDFQIEGMSVGDSLLDYISKESILENQTKQKIYSDDGFYLVSPPINEMFNKSTTYDFFRFHLKKDDNFYKIHSVSGAIEFGFDGFNQCIKKKNEIIKDLVKIFGTEKKSEGKLINHSYDKTGDSKKISTHFKLNNGDIVVICYDWSTELANKNNWSDAIEVAIDSKEFINWLENLY